MLCGAADDIEKKGIACTRDLESGLQDELNRIGLTVMETLLKSESADNVGGPPEGERNGGVHAKTVVTLFGPVRGVERTYYYNERTKKGRFPFDERLGLVGRVTPAPADKIPRQAASHPFREAAEELGYKPKTKEWKRKFAYWRRRVRDGKTESVLKSVERDWESRRRSAPC